MRSSGVVRCEGESAGMALPAFRMIGVLRRPGHVTQGPSRAARAAARRSEAVALTGRPVSASEDEHLGGDRRGHAHLDADDLVGCEAPRPSGWSTGSRRRDRDLVVFAGPHSPHLLPSITSAMSLRCAGQTLISSGSRLVRPTDRCRLPPRPTPIPERVAVGVPDSDGCGEECVTCGEKTHNPDPLRPERSAFATGQPHRRNEVRQLYRAEPPLPPAPAVSARLLTRRQRLGKCCHQALRGGPPCRPTTNDA